MMISAIVLAAGRSRRMGVQKLLLPLGGEPMIAHIVDEVLRSPAREVLVVVGHDAADVTAALAGRPVRFIINPDAESEMLGSVRCGLAAMPAGAAALVVLGDQPGISRDVIAELARVFETGERGIVVPVCGGRRGHPLLFAGRYREEVLNRYDDTGLRGLLEAHPDDLREVEVFSPEVLEDVDLPDDYRRAASRLTGRSY